MKNTPFAVFVCLAVAVFLPILTVNLPLSAELNPPLTRALYENDFESGSATPWFDESWGNVKWQVENYSSPSEINSPAPPLSSGTSYLRATRNAALSSGLAVLSSPIVTLHPGDSISFDFWIQSKNPQGNTLEVHNYHF